MSGKEAAISAAVGIIVIGAIGIGYARLMDSPPVFVQQVNVVEGELVAATPVAAVVTKTVAAKRTVTKTVKKTVVAEPVKQSKWMRPRIYPGVKLYYQHNSQSPVLFIGTIVDAVGYGSGGDRTFSLRYDKTGGVEYKLRRILWTGQWRADRIQQEKIIEEFYK